MAKKAAVSACLTGVKCRYDGTDNHMPSLIERLEEKGYELVAFCPEEPAFGTPRPTIDVVRYPGGILGVRSNKTGQDVSFAIEGYAEKFFNEHPDIDLFIGKDRSPSCGVCSARCYDADGNLLAVDETGLMAKAAIERGIEAYDAETYMKDEK
jgi:uncharacterized protein YbbK (DUF523 family)